MKRVIILAILILMRIASFSQPETFKNPIISGFHPDPSICRVGNDYYLGNDYPIHSVGHTDLIKTKKGVKTGIARAVCKNVFVIFKIQADKTKVEFSFGESENQLQNIGGDEELTLISDEVAGGLNGPYVGMYATSNGEPGKATASFEWFKYDGK